MAKFFNEEDLHTVFLDGFDRGHFSALNPNDNAFTKDVRESNWQEYLKSNPTTFQKTASKPVVDVKPEDIVCPDCGGKMIMRTNRQSGNKFWGCATFPKCRGTRDEMGLSKEEREIEKEREKTPTGVNFSHDGVTWKR